MYGQLPSGGALQVNPGVPIGANVVDYLASLPEQRIWHVLRHEKAFTSSDTSGSKIFFDAATSTPQDGNVEKANTISEPQIYFVLGVTMRFEARITAADLTLLLDSLYLTIEVNQRRELGPLNAANFPQIGGAYGTTTVASTTLATNGLPSGQLANWLPVPIVEKGGEHFNYKADIQVSLSTIAASRRVECAQHGFLFRRAVSQ
jgi:hypothetical protein